jgi:hypothetical protein
MAKRERKVYHREYYLVNQERITAYQKRYHKRYSRRRYGLTWQQVLELFESSDGLCALCLEEPATDIDHDHVTGKVRGALCKSCNIGLGWVERLGAGSDAITEYLSTEWSA